MTTIRPHSLRAWLLATRPKTLSGALLSVLSAIALAFSHASWLNPQSVSLALFCVLFATGMQVASNLINDYMDHRDGIDTAERLGPERACQQGWVSLRAMRRAIGICVSLSLLCGVVLLCLLFATSRWAPLQLSLMLGALGLSCVWGAFAYSRWFSRWGLGDVLVLLFFGLVPTGGTYFVLTDTLPWGVLLFGLALGFAVDALLVVNNFRDRDTDRAVGKRTLVHLMGGDRGAWSLYPLVGLLAVLGLVGSDVALHGRITPMSGAAVAYGAWQAWGACKLWRIGRGSALNAVLGHSSMGLLLLLLLLCVAFGLTA